jgi:SAM-dependent methyltransferase
MVIAFLGDDTSKSWEIHGRNEAYYGVFSDPCYRTKNLSDSVIEEFMRSGEEHTDRVLGLVEQHFGPLPRQQRALDFGCGVGRLLLPLARRFDSVTGVDIAPAMLKETQRNAERANLGNVLLSQSLNTLGEGQSNFDFIHSVLVFQHVPVRVGERLISQLLTLLAPGGVAAIQVLVKLRRPLWRKIGSILRRRVSLLRIPANLLNGRPWNEPMMQMNEYRLDRLFALLTAQGVQRVLLQRDGTAAALQAFLIFKK